MSPENLRKVWPGVIFLCLFFTTGWNTFYIQKEQNELLRPLFRQTTQNNTPLPVKNPLDKPINLTDYPLNEGEGYELTSTKLRRFIKANPLVIWQDNFKDPSQGGFVSITQMKDLEGHPVKPQEAVRIFKINLDKDKTEEVLILPNLTFGSSYRPTILKKVGSHYKPLKVAEITGDYYEVRDIRDLNGDGRLDFILQSSSGASSYRDASEVFWHDGENLNSQVFNQWIRLRDFDSNGIFQLLVDSVGGTAGPHSEWAGWTDIYKWNGTRYETANAEYTAYFEKELIPSYISQILGYAEDIKGATDVIQDRINLIRKAEHIVLQQIPDQGINPLQAARHNEKGVSLLKQDRVPEAIEELTQAVQWDPKSPDLLTNLIQAYLAKGDYQQAETYTIKLIGLAPDQAKAWKNLGYIYAGQDNSEKALRSLRIYLQLVPDIDEGIKELMDLFKKESNPKARGVLQKILPELSQGKEEVS
jgi:tetratricopeptide (TPR) repeat protein